MIVRVFASVSTMLSAASSAICNVVVSPASTSQVSFVISTTLEASPSTPPSVSSTAIPSVSSCEPAKVSTPVDAS